MKARVLAVGVLLFGMLSHVVANALPQPEPQALRPTTPSATSPAATTFGIYIKTSNPATFSFIADRAKAWFGVTNPIRDLSELGDYANENQIVIGDPAVSTEIEELAALHGLSTLDLGAEGYELDSRMDPAENHIWRILIVTTSVAGARNAIATVLDEQAGNGTFKEMRARDYPDRSQRGYFFTTNTVGHLGGGVYNLAQWMTDRKADIDEMAKRGINTIYFQTSDFLHLHDDVNGAPGNELGARLKDLFEYCRSFGMEPAVSIPMVEPAAAPFNEADHAVYREGKLIHQEQFVVDTTGTPDTLKSVAGSFDNAGENLDWHNVSGGFPAQWTKSGNWSWNGSKLVLANSGQNDTVGTTVPIVPGSYYVLRVTLTKIDLGTPPTAVGYDQPQIIVQGTANPSGYRMYFPMAELPESTTASIVYECPFLVPVGALSSPYNVDLIVSSRLRSGVNLEVSKMTLDRRNAGFVNLMRDDAYSFEGTSFPGLSVVVTSDNGQTTYQEGTHYVVEDDPHGRQLSWEMPSDGPVSRIKWIGSLPGGPLKVTYTLGVPAEHPGHSWSATPWCFSNGHLYWEYRRMFRDLYGGTGYQLNPKFIHVGMDEQRGVNRCGRCVSLAPNYGRGLSNQDYFTDYLNRLQSILGGITGAEETRIVCLADMLSPYHNGLLSTYQSANWMGQTGASGLPNNEMSELDPDVILQLWSVAKSNDALNATSLWPNHSFMAGPVSGSGETPEQWAANNGWYGTNALGFTILRWDRYELPTTEDNRMLDYGWKRMKHPDASLQGFRGTVFYTDEVDNHEIQLPLGGVLSVYPYGRKGRDPKYQSANCSSVITGSIAWGLGQGTTSLSAAQMNTGPFTHAYNVYGAKTVTLTVNASACTTANCPCGGTASSSTATIYIRVPKYEDCAPDCPEPDEFVTTLSPTDETKEKPAGPDLSSAIRTIQPNPFGSAVAIHFTVPKATKPVMEVFDITGRRVTHAALPEYAAGAWTWTWNGMDESGHRANAGIYFIRARLGPTTEIRRLVKLDQ